MEEEKTVKSVRNKIIITLIGKRFSGKTTLLNSLIFPEIIKNTNYVMTPGYDIRFLPINDTILIKFYDIGEIELKSNENVIQSMSWQTHYVMYLIDPKIKVSMDYISIFEDVFKDNKKIIVFNKIDQVQDIKEFTNNKNVQDFITKYNIKDLFYVNSFDDNSINNFKNALFNIIREDIINKVFNKINNEVFNENLILYHKPTIDFSKRINIKNM